MSTEAAQVVYVEKRTNGMAVAALTLGVVGTVFGMIPLTFAVAFICGTLAAIFGIVGIRNAKERGRKGLAIAGTVLAGAALALGVVGVVITSAAVNELDRQFNEISDDFDRDMNKLDRQLDKDLKKLNRQANS
ncbi:MAG: DUF4190 domain-containing protein [Actinomycetota bacterium]